MCFDHLGAVIDRALGLVLQTADAVHLVAVRFHVPPVFCAVPACLRAINLLASARGLIELGSALAAVRRGGGHVRPFCVCFSLCLGGFTGAGGGGAPPSRYQATSVVVVPVRRRFGALLRPFPRRWLHRLHIVRPLSRVLVPPSDHGVMWSGSGLSGWRLVSHASVTPQVGQVVCPAARSRLRTAARQRLCPVVPVLLVVMVGGGWLLAGGGGLWFPPPPGWLEGGVVRPGGVVRLALVGGGVVVGGRAVRVCGAGFLGDLREP